MAERLSSVETRIASVRQLSSVVTAMRALAAAHSSEAREMLPGIAAYADTVGTAISQVLALLTDPATGPTGEDTRKLLIVLGAEQGFVGSFNASLLERVEQAMGRSDVLFIVGSRGALMAEERGLDAAWTAPMANHAKGLDRLANRLADAIFSEIAEQSIGHIEMIHAHQAEEGTGVEFVRRSLVPFDYSRFPPVHRSFAPVTHMPLPALLQSLSEEYVFAELCEALTLSFAAENAERLRAMIAAREHVADRLDDLTGQARLLRQAEITEEVIELASGTRL